MTSFCQKSADIRFGTMASCLEQPNALRKRRNISKMSDSQSVDILHTSLVSRLQLGFAIGSQARPGHPSI
ncbi:hypothetical protein GE21DRAFT_1013537 [Neurospora crassa]|nr:hypothetical protein GE21DRAFT_1013537 [Neurospora crassa]